MMTCTLHLFQRRCLMPYRKPGCVQCRKRHIRCDAARPSCNTCRRAKDGRQCAYVSLDIRPARYVQEIGRQTLNTPAARVVVSQPSRDSGYGAGIPRSRASSALKAIGRDQGSWHVTSRLASSSTISCTVSSDALRSPSNRRASTLAKPRPWPSKVVDPLEATLFEYYINEAGYYLDIVSPEHYMSRAAPILALSDPLLYSACLAYSSHVLYLLGRLDKASEQRFNDSAIQLLIQKLSEDPSTWSEGSVLTTTVLMRVTEQFSEIADDGEYHLNGAFSVTASAGRTWDLEPVDLETTAFWTYLRMSVRMCFLCEHATKCDPIALVRIPTSHPTLAIHALAEAALTNRMTYLMAKICNACWPSARAVDRQELMDLRAELYELERVLPPPVGSWSSCARDNIMYPTVKYISTWHAIFWQFFHAADVLLAANFALLSPSPTLASQGQYLEREILGPTRRLLAVALSSDEIGLRINAAALVGWCGQFLTQSEEQDSLIAWLTKLSADAAWPSKTVTGRLRRIWAGEQNHWTADPVE